MTPVRNELRRLILGFGLMSVALLWACDDQNLFEPQDVARPQIVALSAPDQVRAGQTFDVRVRALAELRMDSIAVRARGAFSDQVTQVLDQQPFDATTDVSFAVPDSIADTIVVVTATAFDVAGNASDLVSDTVRVLDSTAPTVTVTVSKTVVGLGREIGITVEAEDNVGLESIGFRLIQEFPDTLSGEIAEDTLTLELAAVAGSKRDSTFLFTIPPELPEGTVRVEGFAFDLDGNEGTATASAPLEVIFIDDELPVVTIVLPRQGSSQPVGDSLFVEADLSDNGQLSSVSISAFSERGDPDLGTDSIVPRFEPKTINFDTLPSDTTITRILLATADTVADSVTVVVTATDAQGNEGTDTTRMLVGGPRIEILNLENGATVSADRTQAVRLRGTDFQLQVVELTLEITGVVEETIELEFSPAVDSITVDTAFVIPGNTEGQVVLQAFGVNSAGISGESSEITLNVVPGEGGDDVLPRAAVTASATDRLETRDVLSVEVTGADDTQGSGLVRAGYTVLAISPTRGDTLALSDEVTFATPRTGTAVENFEFAPFNVDVLSLPDTLIFEINSFFFDDAGNCGASGVDTLATFDCGTVNVGGEDFIVVDDQQGLRATRTVVDGRTAILPDGGTIADAVVDPVRPLLVLSNHDRDRLEIFDLVTESFGRSVPVGFGPWGIAFNRRNPDTLFVANAGGGPGSTNLSRVFMGSDDPEDPARGEDVTRRIRTFEQVFLQWKLNIGEDSRVWTEQVIGFSDRPQFIAHDSTGRLVFSTAPTSSAPEGTIRLADEGPDPVTGEVYEQTAIRIFFEYALPDAIEDQEDTWVFANVDSMLVGPDVTFDPPLSGLALCDHKPGFPSTAACTAFNASDPSFLDDQMRELIPESDAFAASGAWNIGAVALTDTTFVAASGDGGWVAFGEGASAPTGRIILFNAGVPSVSNGVLVQDLVDNVSDRVFGVDLNNDGTLGGARGERAYVFTNDLRPQGSKGLPAGGAGFAFHPLHANAATQAALLFDPNTHLAFAGTGSNTIAFLNTFQPANGGGEIHIRDVVVGPLRTSLPLAEDNADLPAGSCDDVTADGAIRLFDDAAGQVLNETNDDRCVVLKAYGVTDSGGVVVVNVKKNDILRNHPARQN